MEQYLVLGSILVIPALFTVFLRTNASLLFFVVAGAFLLKFYLDTDITRIAGSFIPGDGPAFATVGLLVVPFLIVAFAFKGTVRKSSMLFHILTAVLTGGTLVYVSQAFVTPGIAGRMQSYPLWSQIEPFNALVIATAFLFSVLILWLATPKEHSGKHKKHHK